MGAPGLRTGTGLHYMDNYIGTHGRSGDVNITFEDGLSTIVSAVLDSRTMMPTAACWSSSGMHDWCRAMARKAGRTSHEEKNALVARIGRRARDGANFFRTGRN